MQTKIMNKYNQYCAPINFFRMCHGEIYSKDILLTSSTNKADVEYGEELSILDNSNDTNVKVTPIEQNFKRYCFLNQRIR